MNEIIGSRVLRERLGVTRRVYTLAHAGRHTVTDSTKTSSRRNQKKKQPSIIES